MPTALVIDADPSTQERMRAIAPQWTLVTAPDGLTGLDLARRHRAHVDLVVLAMDLGAIDRYDTALLVRAVSATLPLLPVTTSALPPPLLDEIGCRPALVKPISPAALQAALQAALNAPPPELRASPALLAGAQRDAAAREQAARYERASQRLALFATCPLARQGMAGYLRSAAPLEIAEAAAPEGLVQILTTHAISAIVADARDHTLACALSSDHAVPILLVASTLLDGLIAATHPEATGVVVASADPAATLAAALRAVLRGRTYRSPTLYAPFADLGLTPREQTLLVLEVQPFTLHERAERMGVEDKTVMRYRQRLRDKLGLARADDLAQWARTYLQTRARTVGD